MSEGSGDQGNPLHYLAEGAEMMAKRMNQFPPPYSEEPNLFDQSPTRQPNGFDLSPTHQTNRFDRSPTRPTRQRTEPEFNDLMSMFANSNAQLSTTLSAEFQAHLRDSNAQLSSTLSAEMESHFREAHKAQMQQNRADNRELYEHLTGEVRGVMIAVERNTIQILDQVKSSLDNTDAQVPSTVKIDLHEFQSKVINSIETTNKHVSQSIQSLARSVETLANQMAETNVSMMVQMKNLEKMHSDTMNLQSELMNTHSQSTQPSIKYDGPSTKFQSRTRQLYGSNENLDSSKTKNHKKSTKSSKGAARFPDSSSSDSDSDSDSSDQSSQHSTRSKHKHQRSRKCSTFHGDKKFSVWYNQFKESVKGLDEDEKLSELKSLMRGDAADFVFDQLPSKTRKSYKTLKRELKHRFRKIENPKTFAAIFSKRNQKSGESVEDYSAELKRLYDKAHPDRDGDTREDDLLRRFFDGLLDREASSQVEFVKLPQNIDVAVKETVHFQQLNKSSFKSRATRHAYSDTSSESDSDHEVRILKGTSRNNKHYNKYPSQKFSKPGNDRVIENRPTNQSVPTAGTFQQIQQPNQYNGWQQNNVQGSSFPVVQNESRPVNQNYQAGVYYQNQEPSNNFVKPPLKCYRCDQLGHTKRNCTTILAPYPSNQNMVVNSSPYMQYPVVTNPSTEVQGTMQPITTQMQGQLQPITTQIQGQLQPNTTQMQRPLQSITTQAGNPIPNPQVQAVNNVQFTQQEPSSVVWQPITPVTVPVSIQQPTVPEATNADQSN